MRYFLPHILALSHQLALLAGHGDGLQELSREGVRELSAHQSAGQLRQLLGVREATCNLLIKTNCIDNAKKIWWDVRPHPFFNTVEVRICDIPMRAEETIAIAALIQATACKLWQLHASNQDFRQYSRALLMENKLRAVRYGLEGKLIDFGKEEEVAERDLILEYLSFVDDVVDELGSREAIAHIRSILDNGSGADRQLRKFKETNGDLKNVVDYMAEETRAGLF